MPFKMKYDKSSFPFKSAVKQTEEDDKTKKEKEVVQPMVVKRGDKDKLEEEITKPMVLTPADEIIGNRFALSPKTKVMRDLFNANLKNQGKDFKLKI